MDTLVKKALFIALFSVSAPILVFAQVHTIPFGAKGNTIQIEVENIGAQDGEYVTVIVAESPEWITFSQKRVRLSDLKSGNTQFASFQFDVIDGVVPNREGEIHFLVMEKEKVLSRKKVDVQSSAPESFELLQNYPNPFNPTTTISYLLPKEMNVRVQIFTILGQEVWHTNYGVQAIGKHQISWNAKERASGVYFYRVIAEGFDGTSFVQSKKMLLIK